MKKPAKSHKSVKTSNPTSKKKTLEKPPVKPNKRFIDEEEDDDFDMPLDDLDSFESFEDDDDDDDFDEDSF